MLLTILSFVLLTIGILYLIYASKHFPYTKSWIDFIGLFSVIIGIVMFIACSIMIISVQFDKDIIYQDMLERKATIEYSLEQMKNNDKNVTINGGVYMDILEYNKEVRSAREWAKNPWTNWFYLQKIADLDYIPLPDGSK